MKLKELKTNAGQQELFRALVNWQIANGYTDSLLDLLCASDSKDFIAGYIDGTDNLEALIIASKLQQFFFDLVAAGNQALEEIFNKAKHDYEADKITFIKNLPMINCTDFVQPDALNKKIFEKLDRKPNVLSTLLFPCAGHASDALYACKQFNVDKNNCYLVEINPRLCKRLEWLGFTNVICGDMLEASTWTKLYNKMKENNLMKFNGIIANEPYGATGANIVKKIIDSVDFDEYVNLLPANDYKRNKDKDLFNYQSDMESINDGFADAAVTTHLAKIHKCKINNMNLDEFERSQYIDRQLDKYFEENSKRSHYAIDAATYKPKLTTFKTDFDLSRCLFIGKRYVSDEHLPYTKKAAGYLVNKERNITHDQLISMSAKSEQANGNVGDFSLAQFNTITEQNNITDFMYSKDGFKFIAKILVSINADSYCHMNKFIPKVDWTRTWTVEEILADYGYTEDEIKEVMEDLKNYKGMED